jgi:hypothetical protein
MKRGLVALALLCGCGSPSAGTESPVGYWLETTANGTLTRTTELALGPFGAGYLNWTFAMTSPSTANLQSEEGTYGGSGTSIAFTPTYSSCPGPVPASTASFTLQGADLVLTGPNGVTTFTPIIGSAPSNALMNTVGCFDSNGNFTAHPDGPVEN